MSNSLDLLGNYDGYPSELQVAYSHANLCIQTKWEFVENPVSSEDYFFNWLYTNRDLTYCGRGLKEWIQAYLETTAYKKKYGETGAAKHRIKRALRDFGGYGPDPPALRQRDLLDAVCRASQEGLRLSRGGKTSTLGYVGFIAKEGDLICLLKHASVPIILRPDSRGGVYSFYLRSKVQRR